MPHKNFFTLLRNGKAVLLYPGGMREVGASHRETTAAVLLKGLGSDGICCVDDEV